MQEEVRSFLGLVNFSARFIPNLISIAVPLHSRTRKQTPFVLGTEQQGAFDALKDSLANAETWLISTAIQKKPNLSCFTDAGPVGLGAVLTQVHWCKWVVAYASRSLTDVERRYSRTEKEALGLVWGCERFHMYLYGVEFTLLTDHKPLEVIYSTNSHISARIERWVLRLQPYKYKVQYVPGKQYIADPLSRLGKGKGVCMNDEAEEFIWFVAETSTPVAMSVQEVEEESWLDPEISLLRECITTGEWGNAPPQYKAVRLSILGKLVLSGTRLPIPAKLCDRVVDLAHEGHQGLTKKKQRLHSKVWWAGIDRQVEAKCKTCHGCQLVALPTPSEPLKHTEFPSQPWQDLAADLMGPLPSGEYVFVVVDYYSRYFEVHVDILKSVTAATIIGSLKRIFCTHGLPQSLKTDNRPQFTYEESGKF